MSYGSFVAASIQERRGLDRKRRAEIDRIKQLITEHLPELAAGGYVDGWAVQAARQLKREGKPFNAAAVSRLRGEMIADRRTGATVADLEREGWK
jgi:P2-related tail formation protein